MCEGKGGEGWGELGRCVYALGGVEGWVGLGSYLSEGAGELGVCARRWVKREGGVVVIYLEGDYFRTGEDCHHFIEGQSHDCVERNEVEALKVRVRVRVSEGYGDGGGRGESEA